MIAREILILVLIVSTMVLYSCESQDCNILSEEITIVGTWQLSKVCASEGASRCELEDMKDAKSDRTITFTEDNEYTSNDEGDICSGSWSFSQTGIAEIIINMESGNCSVGEWGLSLSSLTANEMILSPLCVEPCKNLYFRLCIE